jgi:resuscitation-promoting factor RpfA
MDHGPRARGGIAALVAGEVIAVVILHRLGSVDGMTVPRNDLGRWLRDTPSEDVLLAGIRMAALVAAWWLLATTLLYLVARLARLDGTARAVGWATLPAVRRWADRAAAVSIVAASTIGAARLASADPPPVTSAVPPSVVIELDHRDRSSVPDLPPLPVRTGRVDDTQPASLAPPPVAPPPVAAPDAGHTITPGDNLWSIAAAHFGADSAAEIAPYWRRVVEHNRARLRSGDPNLVYPGEVVDLPPV